MPVVEPAWDLVRRREGPVGPGTVAVAVSLYNYAPYIGACLDSVADQTLADLELVVVDDASDADASLDTAAAWFDARADRFSRALLVRHRHNEGLAAARNTGFRLSRSEAVFVLDADNALFPPALAKLSRALGTGDWGAAYCQLQHFGAESGLGLADVWHPSFFEIGNYVDAMALVRRDTWARLGGYRAFSGWEDYDFWCSCVEAGIRCAFVPEILCRYRVHAGSMLRTESQAAYHRLHPALTLRHPWLRLFSATGRPLPPAESS